jgi:acyl carrier protein
MTRSEFLRKFEAILDPPPESPLSGSELFADLAWDSLTVLSFMALVNKEFRVTLPPEKVFACQKVNDLMDLVADRLEP